MTKPTLKNWVEKYEPMFDTFNETPLDEISQRAFFKGFLAALEAVGIALSDGERGKTDLLELGLKVYDTLHELGPYDHERTLEIKASLRQKAN